MEETTKVPTKRYGECLTCNRSDLVFHPGPGAGIPPGGMWTDARGEIHGEGHEIKELHFKSADEERRELEESLREAERLNLLKNAIAKNEGGRWILDPSKMRKFLLSSASPLQIKTLHDKTSGGNGDVIVTYDTVADSGIWNLDGARQIRENVNQMVESCNLPELTRQLVEGRVMAQVIEAIRWPTYVDRESFTSPPGKIPLLNGVYDVESDKLEPHNPENHFLYQVPVRYDAKATCPRIIKFICQVLPANRRTLVYEIAGYCLNAKAEPVPNRWQRLFFLLGPGDNGKSIALVLITMLLGTENVADEPPHALVYNRFSPAQLDNKLANIAADISDRSLRETDTIKNLTGGDFFAAEHKYGARYRFRNRSIQIYSGNALPESYDDSNAFHKRPVIVLFEAVFSGKEKESEISQALTTPEELSGFFNLAVKAYRHMTQRGTFTGELDTVDLKRDLYRRLSDPIQCFVDDHLPQDYEAEVNKPEVLHYFREYCKKRGYGKTITDRKFYLDFKAKTKEYVRESWYQERDEKGQKTGPTHRILKGIKLELGDLDEQEKL